MPKLKTNKGAAKRFKLTASGKVSRRKAYHNHILTEKTRKRKRDLRRGTTVHPADEKNIKKLLPYGK